MHTVHTHSSRRAVALGSIVATADVTTTGAAPLPVRARVRHRSRRPRRHQLHQPRRENREIRSDGNKDKLTDSITAASAVRSQS